MTETVEPIERAQVWKRVLAAVLDFLTAFALFGFAIAWFTGNIKTDRGVSFDLHGAPSLLLLGLLVAYFFVGRRYAGGTLWDRLLSVGRPQPV